MDLGHNSGIKFKKSIQTFSSVSWSIYTKLYFDIFGYAPKLEITNEIEGLKFRLLKLTKRLLFITLYNVLTFEHLNANVLSASLHLFLSLNNFVMLLSKYVIFISVTDASEKIYSRFKSNAGKR